MRRLTAAVIATAAAVTVAAAGVALSAGPDTAVRAKVVVAGERQPLDVRRIRVVDGLLQGRSYRLPAVGIRNLRALPATHRLVVSPGVAHRWLRVVPARVLIDAGRSRAVGLRLELPDDAEPGTYAVVLGVRPGGPGRAHLTFRVEPAEAGGWGRQAANLAMWTLPALVGTVLVVFRAPRRLPSAATGTAGKRVPSAPRGRRNPG